MRTVIFNLKKTNQEIISLEYKPFDFEHSALWLKSLESSEKNGMEILGKDRVYNFLSKEEQTTITIKKCNDIIKQINQIKNYNIPFLELHNLQQSINFCHRFFVDADISGDMRSCPDLWADLNFHLHGIEILEQAKYLQGQIFVELEKKEYFDIPEDSYQHFTVKNTFGYCYANYAHIGRHLHEAFLARDEHAPDEHIIPQSKISGSSYLWLGRTTSDSFFRKKMENMKRWFIENNLESSLGMHWGDKKLAIGLLPVAKLITEINPNNLIGLSSVESVQLV